MTRRAGLGKGLGALLPTAAEPEASILEIEIDQIRPNPRQPRTEFPQEELEGLAASIRELGVLQPVVVRPVEGGTFELLVGERRLRASRMAGVRRVPAVVREADDREALEGALVENVQREDLTSLEEAHAYRNLVDLFELTQEEVARRVGKSRAHIANTLRLLDLPAAIHALLAEGRLTAGHARALLQIRDPQLQQRTAERVVAEGLSVRAVEAIAREATEPAPAQPERSPTADASASRGTSGPRTRRSKFPDLEEALSDRFGTMVTVEVGRGRGRIVIHFGSRDDLGRLAELLIGD